MAQIENKQLFSIRAPYCTYEGCLIPFILHIVSPRRANVFAFLDGTFTLWVIWLTASDLKQFFYFVGEKLSMQEISIRFASHFEVLEYLDSFRNHKVYFVIFYGAHFLLPILWSTTKYMQNSYQVFVRSIRNEENFCKKE